MSTNNLKNTLFRPCKSRFSRYHHFGALAFLVAVGYAAAVALSGWPSALLGALFVPFSFGTESAVRAVRSNSAGRQPDALATGVGVATAAVATVLAVLAAEAAGV
ncbi:MAG: hypothetical protein ABEJ05_05955 [Haloglomus sp.]